MTKEKRTLSSDEIKLRAHKNNMVIFSLLGLFIIFFSLHMGHASYLLENENPFNKVTVENNYFQDMASASVNIVMDPIDFLPFTMYHLKYLLVNMLIYGSIMALKYVRYIRFKSQRDGETKGTAKWNEDFTGFNEKYSFKTNDGKKNAETSRLDMNLLITSKNKLSFENKKTKRNNNVVILGGSGTGKSFSYILPNIAQTNSSYVITDPSGELYRNMNKFLIDNGYAVKVLNLQYPERGNKYNPFDYIRRKPDGTCDQTSVMAMVASFLDNTEGKQGGGDKFWRDSAEALFCAAAFLLIETRPYKDWTMANVSKLIRQAKRDESSTSSDTVFDVLMKDAGAKNPHSMAYSFYQTFKLASSKTAESILVSTDVKLSKFSIPEINDLTTTDLDNLDNNINLNTVADEKTALFIITKTGGGPYDFLCSMLYNQLFDLLYDKGGVVCPTHFHVYSKFNYPVETMFATQNAAQEFIDLINSSEIKELPSYQESKPKYGLILPNEKWVQKRKPAMNADMMIYYKPKTLEFDTLEKAQQFKDDFKEASIKQTGNSLPWAVTCLLDEFNNINEIPKFDEILATCRKYNINISIVLQNLAQLKGRYKDAWNTILGNCDNFLFLGSNELETCKYVSEVLGEGTILTKNKSMASTELGKANYSMSEQARKLLDPTEIVRMDNKECIYVMRGEFPFKVPKIDFSTHINFKKTGSGNKDLETSDTEMIEYFKRKKKRIRNKRRPVAPTQAKETVTPLAVKEDLAEKMNAYNEKQAINSVNPPKPTVEKEIDKISAAAQAEVTKLPDETEEWLF